MKAAVLHRYDPELRNKEFLVYEEIDDPPAVSYTHIRSNDTY